MPIDKTVSDTRLAGDPVRIIADSPLLRSVDRSSLSDLASELEWVVLGEREALFMEGVQDDALYFVADGRLQIIKVPDESGSTAREGTQVLGEIIAGDVVGDMRSLTGNQRLATVRAITVARLVKLPKEGFDRYLATHPDVTAKLKNIFTPRFYRTQMTSVLQNMFGDLTQDILGDIEKRVSWRHVARDGALFRHGESADRLFVVVSGRLQVLSEKDGRVERVVEEIAQGATVGELGVLSDEAQPTSAVAMRDSVLLEFSHDNFRELATRYPGLNLWLARLMSKRLHGVIRETPAEQMSTNILFIPANDGAPLEVFVRQFSELLSRETTCLFISSAQTDTLLGADGIAQTAEGSPEELRLRAWLDQQETRFRYVIYLADADVTNWTRRCVRQADEIISFGSADAAPNLTDVELEILRAEKSRHVKPRKTLILLQSPATTRPEGTVRWLNERQVDRHFHIRAGNQNDLDRIIRYVLRRETGLVLSGGGSRGFAHVGIIRAIREAGLPVDFIAGVSMGAIIAAGYAFYKDLNEMVPVLMAEMQTALKDYTLPLVSLVRGRRFDHCLKTLFSDANIEDLWMPFFCVSSNLTRADTVVHRTGSLWRAVRASGSLPGLVPPVVDDGDLLFDGCLMNNLPVDVMRKEIQTGLLIAVDVVPPVDLDVHATTLDSPSGWRIALNRINPFTGSIKIPGIVAILQRAGQLASLHNRRQRIDEDIADLYLRPPLEQFKILDFSAMDETVNIGYSYGVTEIDAWKKRE